MHLKKTQIFKYLLENTSRLNLKCFAGIMRIVHEQSNLSANFFINPRMQIFSQVCRGPLKWWVMFYIYVFRFNCVKEIAIFTFSTEFVCDNITDQFWSLQPNNFIKDERHNMGGSSSITEKRYLLRRVVHVIHSMYYMKKVVSKCYFKVYKLKNYIKVLRNHYLNIVRW